MLVTVQFEIPDVIADRIKEKKDLNDFFNAYKLRVDSDTKQGLVEAVLFQCVEQGVRDEKTEFEHNIDISS